MAKYKKYTSTRSILLSLHFSTLFLLAVTVGERGWVGAAVGSVTRMSFIECLERQRLQQVGDPG